MTAPNGTFLHRLGHDARNIGAAVGLVVLGVAIGRNWWRVDQVEAQLQKELGRAESTHEQIKNELRREITDKLDVQNARLTGVAAEIALLRADFASWRMLVRQEER